VLCGVIGDNENDIRDIFVSTRYRSELPKKSGWGRDRKLGNVAEDRSRAWGVLGVVWGDWGQWERC